MAKPKPTAVGADSPADLLDLVGVLWAGRALIAACGAAGLILALAAALFILKSQYRSDATLILTPSHDLPIDRSAVVPGLANDISYITTEMEVIGSHQMMLDLVDRLDLVRDPEFNTRLRAGLLFFDAPDTGAGANSDAIATRVSKAIRITNIRNSHVLQIEARSNDPLKSSLLANTLAELYVQGQVNDKHLNIDASVDWLSERVASLEADIDTHEASAQRLRASLGSPDADILIQRLNETRAQLVSLQRRQDMLGDRAQMLETLTVSNASAVLLSQIDDARLQALLGPAQQGQTVGFDNRLRLLRDQTDRDMDLTGQQVGALTDMLAALEVEFEEQAAVLARLRKVERDARATELLHETFLTRLKETVLRRGLQRADSRIVSAAIPGEKVMPRTARMTVLGMVIGLCVGAAFVVFRHQRRSAIPTAEQLEAATSVPVLGHLPKAPIRDRRQLVGYLTANPTAPLSEAVRNLRTSLLLPKRDTPPQVILCTSSLPNEGKTTAAIALAHNLAGLGRSVLLIEADIRCRTFHEYFPENPLGGVVSLLSERAHVEDVVRTDTRLGVDVLMGESSRSSAADLFSSTRFRDLLQGFRNNYDHILIDTPPVLAVPDARVIGQLADAILMTVAVETTTRAQVQQALREFASVNLHVSGLVMSDLKSNGTSTKRNGRAYGALARYYAA